MSHLHRHRQCVNHIYQQQRLSHSTIWLTTIQSLHINYLHNNYHRYNQISCSMYQSIHTYAHIHYITTQQRNFSSPAVAISGLLFGGDRGSGRTTSDEKVDSQPAEQQDDTSNKCMTPSQLVKALDSYIVGQHDAKKAVAVALRNRWRRQQLDPSERIEVTPKNILLIGPTGCGKTEIARRLAKLTQSPFIKVEATKFTEVGFVGNDVDIMIKDLVRIGINNIKNKKKAEMKDSLIDQVNTIIIEALYGKNLNVDSKKDKLNKLINGELEHELIEIDMPAKSSNISFDFDNDKPNKKQDDTAADMNGRTKRRKVQIRDARPALIDSMLNQKVDMNEINEQALTEVQNDGIVFIDEIDKICSSSDNRAYNHSADASAEGVQRDLLPLIEGTTIQTSCGNVDTDHILFICSGAFHSVKPSDLLPELQGRLPIRVNLKPLTEDDLYKILTEPTNNLIVQQIELMKTEGIELVFNDDAIRHIAHIAHQVNTHIENIGARRLHTIVSRIMDEHAYNAPDVEPGSKITITKGYVENRVKSLLEKTDLKKYII